MEDYTAKDLIVDVAAELKEARENIRRMERSLSTANDIRTRMRELATLEDPEKLREYVKDKVRWTW